VRIAKMGGVLAVILASGLGALSSAGIFLAHRGDPSASPLAGMSLRVLLNFSCLGLTIAMGRDLPSVRSWKTGRGLWLWGVFGSFSLLTYYYAVLMMGPSKATLLNAGSGIFMLALVPVLAGRKISKMHLVLSLISGLGLLLVVSSSYGFPKSGVGIALGLSSGLFSAIAYSLVSGTPTAFRPDEVLVHWGIINLLVMTGMYTIHPWSWPKSHLTWAYMIATGLLMAGTQYLTTVAYQKGPRAKVACLGFLGPLLLILLDVALIGSDFTFLMGIGTTAVLASGVIAPLYLKSQ